MQAACMICMRVAAACWAQMQSIIRRGERGDMDGIRVIDYAASSIITQAVGPQIFFAN